MKVYESKDIRNVGLIGHGHSGKTSLTAGILFATGATNRLTRVDEGSTITDFDDDEIQRKVTISTGIAFAEWQRSKINFLDTPGFNIFINDTRAVLAAADAALVLVDGVAGVEVQTEKVWQFSNDFQLPRGIILNKLDRERASFERALENVQANFGRTAVPIHLPIGVERDFRGVVDLISMKAFTYTADGDGKGREESIPADMAETAKKAHEALVEIVAEGNDALMEEFFEQGALSAEHLLAGLRQAVLEQRVFPVMCAAALHNVGTDLILNFIADYLPAPNARGEVKGKSGDQEVSRKISDSEPVSAFVFKTIADPFAGRVSYFKVFSGVLKNDANLTNALTSGSERLAHIGCVMGKTIQPVTDLHAGDIGAVAKLKETLTGDTLWRQGVADRVSAREAAGALDRLRHGSQVAAG